MQTPTRILLIDDDAQDRASVRTALAGSNLAYTLMEAAEGEAALAEACRQAYDCVMLRRRVGQADDWLQRLVSAEGGRQAVVALSDSLDETSTLALLRDGAVDNVTPADAKALAQAIVRAKNRRGLVSELEAALDDAESKARPLDEMNRQKTLILSTVAHDLRNPLQVLLGMSEILADAARVGDLKAVTRRAEVVLEAAEQAHALIDSLFAWANLYMHTRALEPTRVNLVKLFSDCTQGLQEQASEKGVAIETEAGGLAVLAQEDVAAAILRNLVANAVKFTPSAGRVAIGAALRGDKVAISVTDTGVGMTEAQTASLFQRNRRASSAGTAGERGAGLGLLLCRDLCDWAGGEIEAESRVGEGATFRVLLPAAG